MGHGCDGYSYCVFALRCAVRNDPLPAHLVGDGAEDRGDGLDPAFLTDVSTAGKSGHFQPPAWAAGVRGPPLQPVGRQGYKLAKPAAQALAAGEKCRLGRAVRYQSRTGESGRDGLEYTGQGRDRVRVVHTGAAHSASALQVVGIEILQGRGDILHGHARGERGQRE